MKRSARPDPCVEIDLAASLAARADYGSDRPREVGDLEISAPVVGKLQADDVCGKYPF